MPWIVHATVSLGGDSVMMWAFVPQSYGQCTDILEEVVPRFDNTHLLPTFIDINAWLHRSRDMGDVQ